MFGGEPDFTLISSAIRTVECECVSERERETERENDGGKPHILIYHSLLVLYQS